MLVGAGGTLAWMLFSVGLAVLLAEFIDGAFVFVVCMAAWVLGCAYLLVGVV